MPVTYTNRRGQIYYLHQGTTKTGKPRYQFSTKKGAKLADSMPAGFEIYENPNGRVYCRRIRPKIITDSEVAVIDKGMKQFSKIEHYQIDVKKDTISVYTADQNLDSLLSLMTAYAIGRRPDPQETLSRWTTYSPMMQFVLVDKDQRLFVVQRYFCRGRDEGWIEVGGPGRLPELVDFLQHLGQDSYYELI